VFVSPKRSISISSMLSFSRSRFTSCPFEVWAMSRSPDSSPLMRVCASGMMRTSTASAKGSCRPSASCFR
jgi:hypothetical protein